MSSLPATDTSDISTANPYPEPILCNTVITKQQIERAIGKLAPNKAPGPNEITNRVLKETFGILHKHLQLLTQASIDTGYFPAAFKNTLTVVLRKPNKPDYTKAKAYRPIALENTIGKVIESVITELLNYLIEENNLISANHFGGRPQ